MTILVEPMEITTYEKEEEKKKNYDPHLATLMRTIFGPRLGKVRICHMSSANGVRIELFQFIEHTAQSRQEEETNFEYWKTGYFHIALTEPNIEELADKIASTGGKRRTNVMEYVLFLALIVYFF